METNQTFAVLGLIICILSILACMLVGYSWIYNRTTESAERSIINRAIGKLATIYMIDIYLVKDGAFVQVVATAELDSVFKVAQYVPPKFESWITGWSIYDRGTVYRQWHRYYESVDGYTYVVMVGTDMGLWPQFAEGYLAHL